MRDVLLIFVIVGCILSCRRKDDQRAELLVAVAHTGPGATGLRFFEDGTVQFNPGIMSSEVEGNYELKDSILIVRGIPKGSYIVTDRFLITRFHPFNPKFVGKILLQVDSSLQLVNNDNILWVSRDWRDSTSDRRSAQHGLLR